MKTKTQVENGQASGKTETPGVSPKWTARKGGPVHIEGINVDGMDTHAFPHVVAIYNDELGRRCTAYVAECSSATLDNDANARLIAAAPELLSSLKTAVAGFDYNPGHSDLDDEQPISLRITLGDYRRFCRLIAKAEGK